MRDADQVGSPGQRTLHRPIGPQVPAAGERLAGPVTGPQDFVDCASIADVTDENAVALVFAAAPGRLAGVVYSAGVPGGGPVHLLDADGGYPAGRDHGVTDMMGLAGP